MDLLISEKNTLEKLISATEELKKKSKNKFDIILDNPINCGTNNILLKYAEYVNETFENTYIFYISPNTITLTQKQIKNINNNYSSLDSFIEKKDNKIIFINNLNIHKKKDVITNNKQLLLLKKQVQELKNNNKIMFIINEFDLCNEFIDNDIILDIINISDYLIKAYERPIYHNLLGKAKKYGYYTGKKTSSQGYVYCDRETQKTSNDICKIKRRLLDGTHYNSNDISFPSQKITKKNNWNINSDYIAKLIYLSCSNEFIKATKEFFEENRNESFENNIKLKYETSINELIYPCQIFELIDNAFFNFVSKITNVNAHEYELLTYSYYIKYKFILECVLRKIITKIDNSFEIIKNTFSLKNIYIPINYKNYNYKKSILYPCLMSPDMEEKERTLLNTYEHNKNVVAWYKNDSLSSDYFKIISNKTEEIFIPDYIVFYKDKIQIVSLKNDNIYKLIFDKWLEENTYFFEKIIKVKIELIQF